MPGGLLNLVSESTENSILNANPQKSFFKSVFLKYTNFGMQKFRIDYNGLRSIHMTESTQFNFKIPRHGDLLMDTCLAINLPDIWSPLYELSSDNFIEYKFQWIKNIGCEIIEEIEITSNGHTLQKISGTYLNMISHRDFSYNKKTTFDYMSGHRKELYDPQFSDGYYPNAIYDISYGDSGSEPSIRGTTLYIPINVWFLFNSQQAIPLVALQYSEIHINVKLRPVKEWFTIQDVQDISNNHPRIQPNFNNTLHQFYRFINTPPSTEYNDKRTGWNSDVHLIANYVFLSRNEAEVFTKKPQTYIIKDVFESKYYDIANSNIVKTNSNSLVVSWMFAFRRSDAYLRNEWSNFSNWKYKDVSPKESVFFNSDIKVNSKLNNTNNKPILLSAGIIVDGKYRENMFDSGIYQHLSNYCQSNANFSTLEYVYNYNFCLNTSPFVLQPSGAMNFSKFKNIELELVTSQPPISDESYYEVICDDTGAIIGFEKPRNSIYEYTYDMIFFEERYNVLTFVNGVCGLQYAH